VDTHSTKEAKDISYSSYKNKEKNKSESHLEKQLSEVYANNGNETETQDTESKLTQLREKKIKGIMTRAKGGNDHINTIRRRFFFTLTYPLPNRSHVMQ
jgi:hypothetical protein